ncbi:hypothetical protein ACFX13_017374 [Malus domestica]
MLFKETIFVLCQFLEGFNIAQTEYVIFFNLNSCSTSVHTFPAVLLVVLKVAAKSILQKLRKVQLGLQEEQKVCDSLKEKYVAANAKQRHCYSLLKAFQEECAKNEVLRRHSVSNISEE